MKKTGVLLLLLAAPPALAQDKLPLKLTVKELQGGFAGFTGKQWTIEPSGKWEEADVFNRKLTVVRSGTLGKRELAALAGEVKKYAAGKLKSEGKLETNPKVIEVTYGEAEAKLTLGAAAAVPGPDAKTNAGRFGGVLAAVKSAIPKKK